MSINSLSLSLSLSILLQNGRLGNWGTNLTVNIPGLPIYAFALTPLHHPVPCLRTRQGSGARSLGLPHDITLSQMPHFQQQHVCWLRVSLVAQSEGPEGRCSLTSSHYVLDLRIVSVLKTVVELVALTDEFAQRPYLRNTYRARAHPATLLPARPQDILALAAVARVRTPAPALFASRGRSLSRWPRWQAPSVHRHACTPSPCTPGLPLRRTPWANHQGRGHPPQ